MRVFLVLILFAAGCAQESVRVTPLSTESSRPAPQRTWQSHDVSHEQMIEVLRTGRVKKVHFGFSGMRAWTDDYHAYHAPNPSGDILKHARNRRRIEVTVE